MVPYVMPGFVLARACAERFVAERHERTIGMVLLGHGLFTFAEDARTAYENHVDLVARALVRVAGAPASDAPSGDAAPDDDLDADAFGAGDANAFGPARASRARPPGGRWPTSPRPAPTWSSRASWGRWPCCAATSRRPRARP